MNIHYSTESAEVGMQVVYLRDTEDRNETPFRVIVPLGWVPAENLSKTEAAFIVMGG